MRHASGRRHKPASRQHLYELVPQVLAVDQARQAFRVRVVTAVALSMACLAAVRSQGESTYVSDLSWVSGPYPGSDADADTAAAAREFQERRFTQHVLASSGYYGRFSKRPFGVKHFQTIHRRMSMLLAG